MCPIFWLAWSLAFIWWWRALSDTFHHCLKLAQVYKWGCAYTNKLKKSANHFQTAKKLNSVCFFCFSLNMFCLSIRENVLLLIRKVVPAAQLVDQDTNIKINGFNWPFAKTRPLRYCCYGRQAMALSHHTQYSHTVKNTLWSKEKTDDAPTDKTEQVTFGVKQNLSFRILAFLNKFQQ